MQFPDNLPVTLRRHDVVLSLQVVVDDAEAFRSKVKDAVAVIDSLNDHKQNWLEEKSCLEAQIARFDATC